MIDWEEYQRQQNQEQAEQEEAMWKSRQQWLEEQETEAYDNEICFCGHTHEHHYVGEGHCQNRFCDCSGFDEPIESWELLTETNLGGDPGGFLIYE